MMNIEISDVSAIVCPSGESNQQPFSRYIKICHCRSGLSMKFYSIYNNRLEFQHLVSCLSKASSKCCLPFGPGKIRARCLFTFGSSFSITSDWSDFDSSTSCSQAKLFAIDFLPFKFFKKR